MEDQSSYRIIQRKNTWLIYVTLIGGAAASLLVLLLTGSDKWYRIIFSCLFNASLSALSVSFLIKIITQKDNERKMANMINGILVQKDCKDEIMPAIHDVYDKDQLGLVLRNTIKAYTGNNQLSDNYMSAIKRTYKHIKRDEVYLVTISGENEDGKYHIRQDFQATFIYQPPKETALKAFFILKPDDNDEFVSEKLSEKLNDYQYVFREKIEDKEFCDKLESLCDEHDSKGIIEALNLKIYLFDNEKKENEVPVSDIIVNPHFKNRSSKNHYYGIEIVVPADVKKYVRPDKDYPNNDQSRYHGKEKYVRARMRIEVEYPIPDNSNSFCLAYTRPTIESHFVLDFVRIPKYTPDRVIFMPFMTYLNNGGKDNDGVVIKRHDRFELTCKELILPHSGVSFFWNFREPLSRFEQNMVDNGLIDIQRKNKNIIVDLAYSSTSNFTGKDLYGGMNKAYLVPELAMMLSKAQEILSSKYPGYKLLVFDAARPKSVQKLMFEWAKKRYTDPEKYVKDPDKIGWHIYGAAVDVTIVDNKGKQLKMGTAFDDFSLSSHIDDEDTLLTNNKITIEEKKNRELLREIMRDAGFDTYDYEWWHFQKYNEEELMKNGIFLDF